MNHIAALKRILLLTFVLPAGLGHANVPSLHDTTFCAPDGIALGGYDAVSYHQINGPIKGSGEYRVTVGTLTFQFATLANQETFEQNPEQYTPTYLGWCSATLSMGRLACPDYTNFQIENGRLLLFERIGFTNGRDMWNADPRGNKARADENFIKLSQ